MKKVNRIVWLIVVFLMVSYALAARQNVTNGSWKEIHLVIERDSIKIGGTLIIPVKLEVNSLVIMSSGSGPQDRDETLFGFKIFKVIAEHLGSKGIASFRYDDRGEGESTGDFVNSTIDDLTSDVEAVMDFFKTYNEYPFNEFALFGHSQGGIIAAKAAAANESVKQLLLMAAPSVPLVEVVLAQVRNSYAATNLSAALIEGEVSAHAKLMSAIYKSKEVDRAIEVFKRNYGLVLSNLPSSDAAGFESKVNATANELEIIYGLPSLASFLYYDPANDLGKLTMPVLALFGGNDAQVSIQQNKDRMEGALLKSGTPYHFAVFNDANHFFQKSNTGLRGEYDTLQKEFVDGFLAGISEWLLQQASE